MQMECPDCRGYGCEKCNNTGRGYLEGCPQACIDRRFKRDLNKAIHAINDKLLPKAGGIGDQDARFVALWRKFASDVNLIENDKAKSDS